MVLEPERNQGKDQDQFRKILKRKVFEMAVREAKQMHILSFKHFLPKAKRELLELKDSNDAELRSALFSLFPDGNFVRLSRLIQELFGELVKQKKIEEGKMVFKSLVLSNPRRAAIHSFISNNPGTFVKEIVTHFQFGVNPTYHHLFYLKKFDFVRETAFMKRRHYFNASLSPEFDFHFIVSRRENYWKLLRVVQAEGEARINYLKNRLGKHHSTIHYLVKNLEACGLVTTRTNEGRKLILLRDPASFSAFLEFAGTREASPTQ
ncbi:MAG: hypothetical protein ACTSU5_00745 [Promethearchaeota archaeon]